MANVIGPQGRVEPRNVTMYAQQWATVEAYAKDEGYPVSLALRKIVDEWVEFKRHQLTDASPAYHTGEPS